MDERRQFRILYRSFLSRMIDLDVLAATGETSKLASQVLALLAAFSFVVAYLIVPRYALSRLRPSQLAFAAWGDQEFFVATSMTVAGLFAVLCWDSVFPSRRDSYVLGALPVSSKTIFSAKTAAIATALGLSLAAVNVFTGLSYPMVAISPQAGALGFLRSFGAYWITMTGAALFVFSAIFALQGLTAQLLSYRMFLRMSSYLQAASFFLVLGAYFLTPGAAYISLDDPTGASIAGRIPSYWFLGLFQELNGSSHPIFAGLALRAVTALAIAITLAALTQAATYFRTIRNIVEQPDILPGDRAKAPVFVSPALIFRTPFARGVASFTIRTMVRSRQHRIILAAFAGLAFAISLGYLKHLLYATTPTYEIVVRMGRAPKWYEPNRQMMAVTFILSFFAVAGSRAIFSLPATLPANWIFLVTMIRKPSAYLEATRTTLYFIAVIPVLALCSAVLLSAWPMIPSAKHLVLVALIGIFCVERSLRRFRKIPFTCSYLPGKSNLKVKFGAYAILLLALIDLGVDIEAWALRERIRYAAALALALYLANWARRETSTSAASNQPLVFEDVEESEIAPLNLTSLEAYANPPVVEPPIPRRTRALAGLRRFAIAAATVVTIGVTYDQIQEWRHRRLFQQIGTRFDIGGRALNIYCSGSGSPTVIFESGAGGPGYAWTPIQREVAKFTRACWYDRAGYGWSDSAPYPRTSSGIAQDLHALLDAAKVLRPVVLVGASFGGMNVRLYNSLYPADVAGMVLVDSSHFDEHAAIVPSGSYWLPYWPHFGSLVARFLKATGLLRLVFDMPEQGVARKWVTAQEDLTMHSFEPRTLAENSKELFYESAVEARAAQGLGDKPLIVLTTGLSLREVNNPVEARQALAQQKQWIEIQKQLLHLSTRSEQIVVENSNHGIQDQAPEAVLAAIQRICLTPDSVR